MGKKLDSMKYCEFHWTEGNYLTLLLPVVLVVVLVVDERWDNPGFLLESLPNDHNHIFQAAYLQNQLDH